MNELCVMRSERWITFRDEWWHVSKNLAADLDLKSGDILRIPEEILGLNWRYFRPNDALKNEF